MLFNEEVIREIKKKNNIKEVVSQYVKLELKGKRYVGFCPFHDEKTPSFAIYPESNSFYCFGCGTGGDVITFIKRIKNFGYVDAVKFLADRSGIIISKDAFSSTASKQHLRIWDINREAAKLYHSALYSAQGKAALDYCYNRGYTDATIKHFQMGYAPNSFTFLRDELHKKGFQDEELRAAWLCSLNKKGVLYDIFRNRVIIPIADVRGNVIAFGGRVLDDSKPKYLNSGETPVFKKASNLFALNFAKQSAKKQLILCEGYMDIITLYQAGFKNAVAVLGTAFTAEQAKLLVQYTKEVILMFDADAAGKKAIEKALKLLRCTDLSVKIATLPDAKDPDEYILKNNSIQFGRLLNNAISDIEYELLSAMEDLNLENISDKIAYLTRAAEIISLCDDALTRDIYIEKISTEHNVTRVVFANTVKDFYNKNHVKD